MPCSSRTVFSSTTLNCRRSSGQIGLPQLGDGADAERLQPLGGAPADAPDTAHAGWPGTPPRARAAVALPRWHTCAWQRLVAARLSVGHLGHVVGELGQGLGGAEAHAGGQARPLQHLGPHRAAPMSDEVAAHAVEIEETTRRCCRPPGAAHAGPPAPSCGPTCRHTARSWPTSATSPARALQVPHLEPGLCHLHAEVLGLVAARDAGAVVVRQHHHRAARSAQGGTPVRS